ncbi:hypothetical protein JOM56_002144 [Amanita muscaria]
MDNLHRGKSKTSDKLQTKTSFGDIVGLWRRKSEVARSTCDRCTDRVRPVYRGRRPLQVTDIHRVIDIMPQKVEDYENPLWLVRHIAEEQSNDSAASQSNCQLSPACTDYVTSERRRTLSLDTKNLSRAPATEGTKALFLHPEQHSCSCTAGSKSHKRFHFNSVAPLRLRRNQNRSESDVTRLGGGCLVRDERLPYAQSLGKRSNTLPLDDALSPLQRMTNKLNEWTTGIVPDDGARLRPGPAAHLPVVRRAKHSTLAVDSPKSAKSPASACPPFPSISHSSFDLRCASQKPGYHRTRLHSSPCPYGLGRSRMLPICQKSSAVVGRR